MYLELGKAVLTLYPVEEHLSQCKLQATCFRITWVYYLKYNLVLDASSSQKRCLECVASAFKSSTKVIFMSYKNGTPLLYMFENTE